MSERNQTDEIGLTEIATILDCCRQSAYIKLRTGEIRGGRLVAGKLWVCPRKNVLRFKRAQQAQAEPLVAA